MVVQCAWDLDHPNAAVRELQAERDRQIAALETDTQETLSQLRRRLLLIGLATFAAALVMGLVLLGAGLAPLRRLTDAVSRVSEKDFLLPIDAAKLPRELKPIAERMAQTLKLLGQAFEREKQAAADISHELRTPLAALLTTMEVSLRKPRTPEQYRETLAECRVIGKQMSRLVERILSLARLDAGADRYRPSDVDAGALVEECMTVVRPLAEAGGLDVKLACADSSHLTTDPDKLREVLMNLLHNAIEYNRPGGRVEMNVFPESGSAAEANGKGVAGSLVFEVRDTGIGIAPEARERIFERFYRADAARQATGLHAGLGLAIVKEFVTLMGGRIAVESRPGEGSSFRVTLPNG
jgi:signal transduction histidine kinase